MRGLLLLALFCAFPASAMPELVDDEGHAIGLEKPAQRIITLAPHLAELVFAAGAGEHIIATVEWSDYPAEAVELPRVGDSFRVDMERVISLNPDIVLAWGSGTPQETVNGLRTLGLKVAVLQPTDLESIARQMEWVGRLTGEMDAAEAAAENFRVRRDALAKEFSGRATVSVFYQISSQPLYTVSDAHSISALIRLCGGRNVFAELEQVAPAVSREAVLARNPEAVVAGKYSATVESLEEWREWPELAATRMNNLFTVPAELVARATPRILDGAEILCERLETAREHRAAAE